MALVLTGAGALTLAGCGGGGGTTGGGDAGTIRRRASALLPANFPLPPSRLTLLNGPSGRTSASGPTFDLTLAAEAPTLAWLIDSNDRTVLVGFLDPALDAPTLTPRSAGVAQLFFALGGFLLPAARKREVLALLDNDPAVALLGDTIARRLVANPYALEDGDPEIGAALKVAFNAVWTVGRAVKMRSTLAPITRSAQVPALLQLQPGEEQSGISLNQADAAQTVTLTQTNRLRARALVYKVGTVDVNGGSHPLAEAAPFGSPLDIPPVTSCGPISAIAGIVAGQTSWAPITAGPIRLEMDDGAAKTLYEVIVLVAATNDIDRAFFAEPKYASAVSGWKAQQDRLSRLTWLEGIWLNLALEVIGGGSVAYQTSVLDGVLTALEAIELQTVKAALAKAGKLSLLEATKDTLSVFAEDALIGKTLLKAMEPLIAAVARVAEEETAALLAAKFKQVFLIGLEAFGLGLVLVDMAAVIADGTRAKMAERWSATLFQPTLILDPTAKTIAPGQRVTFSVKPPVGTTGTISYAWTQTGATSTLSSSDGIVGNSITTASTSVDLVTTQSDSGKITVTVVATLTEPSGKKSELGTAQAVITIDITSVFVGATKKTFALQNVDTLSGQPNGKYEIFGGFVFTLPATAWKLAQALVPGGTAGSLSRTDYDAGAPLFATTGNVVNGGAGYGGTKFLNLGGGTVFLSLQGIPDVLAANVQQAENELAQILDQYHLDAITFTRSRHRNAGADLRDRFKNMPPCL